MINLCVLTNGTGNSSPQFTEKPVIFTCCNQLVRQNLGLLDTIDLDSFSISLSNPLNNFNVSSNYNSPYTSNKPISCDTFIIDSLTGEVLFTPKKCNEVSVVSILVKEFRRINGVQELIGTISRDVQIIVENCPSNNAPTINAKFNHTICEGDKIKFTISGKDLPSKPTQTVGDTVEMRWNGGISNASFVIKNPTGKDKVAEFEWQTKLGDARHFPYIFTASAIDDNCPLKAKTTRAFSVIVNKRAEAQQKYRKLTNGRLIVESILPKDFLGKDTHIWDIRDSNLVRLATKSYSTQKYDTLILPKYGKYIMIYTINNLPYYCSTKYTDTIIYTKNSIGFYGVLEKNLRFYPNPIKINGTLNIELFHPKDMISIYDIMGSKLRLKQKKEANMIHISGFETKGLYMIERSSFGKREYYKLIVY